MEDTQVAEMEKLTGELKKRVIGCVALSVSAEKIPSIDIIVHRNTAELLTGLECMNPEQVNKNFSNFVNRTLSAIEAIGLSDSQYKAVRKLVLTEIYGCKDIVLKRLSSKEVKLG